MNEEARRTLRDKIVGNEREKQRAAKTGIIETIYDEIDKKDLTYLWVNAEIIALFCRSPDFLIRNMVFGKGLHRMFFYAFKNAICMHKQSINKLFEPQFFVTLFRSIKIMLVYAEDNFVEKCLPFFLWILDFQKETNEDSKVRHRHPFNESFVESLDSAEEEGTESNTHQFYLSENEFEVKNEPKIGLIEVEGSLTPPNPNIESSIHQPLSFLEDDFVKECHSEVFCLFNKVAHLKGVNSMLSQPSILRMLNKQHTLNSVQLLEKLLSIENIKHVDILKLRKHAEALTPPSNLKVISCCITWYLLFFQKHNAKHKNNLNVFKINQEMHKIIALLDSTMHQEKDETLLLLGRIAENNLEAQQLSSDIGILDRALEIFLEAYNTNRSILRPLYCIYSLTSSLEENRKKVCCTSFIPLLFKIWRRKLALKDYDSTLYLVLCVLKSLTRSVKFLRAGLQEYPVLELSLHSLEALHLLIEDTPDISSRHLLLSVPVSPLTLTKEIFSILSNLLLEFGNYKSKFIKKNSMALILSFSHFQNLTLSVLFLLKNYLYDSLWGVKESFVSSTDPSFFDSFFPEEPQLHSPCSEQLFCLIRNLLCGTSEEIEIILRKYPTLLTKIFFFFRLSSSTLSGTLIQIIYILVNLSAANKKYKNEVLKDSNLQALKRLFLLSNKELEVSLIWLIINLTWKGEEEYEQRTTLLRKSGAEEWLKGVRTTDPVVVDKIKTALTAFTNES